MNTGLKNQITSILESSSNQELKDVLKENLSKINSDYYVDKYGNNFAREVVYDLHENLSKINSDELSYDEKQFLNKVKTLNRKEFLKDLNMETTLTKLTESEEFSSLSPSLQFQIEKFKTEYQKDKRSSTSIAKYLLEAIRPYDYLSIAKKTKEGLNYIFENYSREILIFEAINFYEDKNIKGFYSKLIKRLEDYLTEGSKETEDLLNATMNESSFDRTDENIFQNIRGLFSNKNKSLNVLAQNENFSVHPIYSFVYECDFGLVFTNGSEYFAINENKISILNNEEISKLSSDYVEICNFVNNSRKFSIQENEITLSLDSVNTVRINMEGKTPVISLNNVVMEAHNVYPTLMNTFMLDSNKQKLAAITKSIVERLNSFNLIDFGKNIVSKTQDGNYATIFKLNEQFFGLLRNWKNNETNFLGNVPVMNLRNEIFEFMRYDIATSLYEYLGNDFQKIGDLKSEKTEILSTIEKLKEGLNKIDENVNSLSQVGIDSLKQEIYENIDSLKERYSEISSLLENLESSSEISSINERLYLKKN